MDETPPGASITVLGDPELPAGFTPIGRPGPGPGGEPGGEPGGGPPGSPSSRRSAARSSVTKTVTFSLKGCLNKMNPSEQHLLDQWVQELS